MGVSICIQGCQKLFWFIHLLICSEYQKEFRLKVWYLGLMTTPSGTHCVPLRKEAKIELGLMLRKFMPLISRLSSWVRSHRGLASIFHSCISLSAGFCF